MDVALFFLAERMGIIIMFYDSNDIQLSTECGVVMNEDTEQKLADEENARQALEARTVDKVSPGEQQPETDHRMETDNSDKGNTEGVFFRDAKDGHYFSYLMQTKGS